MYFLITYFICIRAFVLRIKVTGWLGKKHKYIGVHIYDRICIYCEDKDMQKWMVCLFFGRDFFVMQYKVQVYIYRKMCIFMCMYTRIYIYISIHILYVYIHICVFIHTRTLSYVHSYKHAHTQTHTHTIALFYTHKCPRAHTC